MNHTPGPWTIDQYGHVYGPWTQSEDKQVYVQQHIAQCNGMGKNPADIKLVAAAPELLAACEAVLDAMTDPNFDDHFDGAKLELMLQNVVDKARGEG